MTEEEQKQKDEQDKQNELNQQKSGNATTAGTTHNGSGDTLGERRVRTTFNPDKNEIVDQIKQKTADLINLVEQIKGQDARLASLAQTSYEEAAMWAVKAATA